MSLVVRATAPQISPYSTLCVFLGYFSGHNGFQCVDLSSNRVIVTRHVTFDETSLPFAKSPLPTPKNDFDFPVSLSPRCASLASTGSPVVGTPGAVSPLLAMSPAAAPPLPGSATPSPMGCATMDVPRTAPTTPTRVCTYLWHGTLLKVYTHHVLRPWWLSLHRALHLFLVQNLYHGVLFLFL